MRVDDARSLRVDQGARTVQMRILVVNAGSTSLKLRVVERDDRVTEIVDLGTHPATRSKMTCVASWRRPDRSTRLDTEWSTVGLGSLVPSSSMPEVRAELDEMNDLAPLHNPPALAAIDALRHLSPDVPAVACFDTAFHTSLKPAASSYALPDSVGRPLAPAPLRLPRAQLRVVRGSCCRRCLERPVDSLQTRDLPPGRRRLCDCDCRWSLGGHHDGLHPDRGTRDGDAPWAMSIRRRSRGSRPMASPPDELADGLERRSGLLALLDGSTGDMREMPRIGHPRRPDRPGCRWTSICIDFGPRSPPWPLPPTGPTPSCLPPALARTPSEIRDAVCEHLEWLGLSVDNHANAAVAAEDLDISRPDAAVRALVIHAREELVIAAGCRAALG